MSRGRRCSRGTSIVEAMLVVVVVAVAVPPSLRLMDDTAAARVDAVNTHRAAALLSAVLETVAADASSAAPGLGFAALADAEAYEAGLRARVAWAASVHEAAGVSWTLEVSGLVDASGGESGEAGRDVYRRVTVTAAFASASGGAMEVPASVMVRDGS